MTTASTAHASTAQIHAVLEEFIGCRSRESQWRKLLKTLAGTLQAEMGQIVGAGPVRVVALHGLSEPVDCEALPQGLYARTFPLAAAGVTYGTASFFSRQPFSSDNETESLGSFCASVMGTILESESLAREFDCFVQGATHDVRGAVMRAANFAQLAARASDLAAAQTTAMQSVSELRVLDPLLKDMAAFSLAGSTTERLQRVLVASSVEDARWSLKKTLDGCPEAAITFHHDGEAAVCARPRDLAQIFDRIIGNSLKFCPPNVEVRITAVPSGDCVLITVADNGPGFDPEYAATIFDPFTRLHGKQYPGHGLGLAIVRKLVHGLDGRIWAEVDRGLKISILLPAWED